MQNGFECQQGIFRFSIEGANAIQVGGHGLTAGVAWLQERARFADQTLALPEPKPRWGLQHKPRLVQNLDQARAALVKKGQRILQLDKKRWGSGLIAEADQTQEVRPEGSSEDRQVGVQAEGHLSGAGGHLALARHRGNLMNQGAALLLVADRP